jgi:protoheme IX farnesyltransferase
LGGRRFGPVGRRSTALRVHVDNKQILQGFGKRSALRLHLLDVPVRDYVELTKPRITWLILMSTGIGYFFGLHGASNWRQLLANLHFWPLLHTLVGTGLIASGTAALNQWYERDADRLMRRTAQRPLPTGRVSANGALGFGVMLSVAGFLELWLGVNLLTGAIGVFTLASYLFLYTPLKQRTWWSTTIGAIPGAMPPIIGYAAAAGVLTREAWVLGAILFLWQFPHFYSIAWMYKEDYARAGIRMLPVVEPDGRSTARQIVLFGLALIPVSLIPGMLGMSGRIYSFGALLLGMWFLYSGVRVALDRTALRARAVLLTSVLYLPLIYTLMLLDRPGL